MTPIVLLHAFPQSGAMWAAVADRLADRFAVLTPDLPGFGDAEPAEWSVDSAADGVARLLDAGGHTTAIVGGCSMGSYVALAFARRHPGRLAGLVLVNGRPDADGPESRASREVNLALVAGSGVAALVDKMLPRLLGATTRATRPELVGRVRALGVAQSAGSVRAGLVALRDRPDSTADLSRVAARALVVVGAEDEIVPPELGRSMAAAIPDAALATIPGCGHLAPWEAPEALADAILARFAA